MHVHAPLEKKNNVNTHAEEIWQLLETTVRDKIRMNKVHQVALARRISRSDPP